MDAIILQNISKKYSLNKDRPILLKNLFVPQEKEEIWALKNVSLTIKKGETIGIIGENGSGKSTLLKIIAGITTPTKGTVEINGRVGSLIELGAGFHQDLTGRENIYLNGTLLGFTKKELDKKYREIVEFADIGEYINQPIRTYSSGMTVRLGFSVAVHLDPDILLIDEVLAVGDEEFQRRCILTIEELRKQEKTILFVSHNLPLIENQANRCIWLNNGDITKIGISLPVIQKYLDFIDDRQSNNKKTAHLRIIRRNGAKDIEITDVCCLDAKNRLRSIFVPESTFKLKINFVPNRFLKSVVFGIAVYRETVHLFGSKKKVSINIKDLNKENSLILTLDSHPFLHGNYTVSVGVCQYDQWNAPIDFHQNAVSFMVKKTYETLIYGWISSKHDWKLAF